MDDCTAQARPNPQKVFVKTSNGLPRRSVVRPRLNTRYSAQHYQDRTANAQMTPPLTPQTSQEPLISSPERVPTSFHNYLRAFYHFHPSSTVSSNTEESSITVPINQGDVILVHSIQPNGWADGTLLTSGARGWLPTNYCEEYNHDAMRNLLNALTYVWEFVRAHEEYEPCMYAQQDYVRGMIAGVRVFLERLKCLTRESPLVQSHSGIRRLRKGLLSDLSTFVKAAKRLQEVCHELMTPGALYDHLEDIVLKAFKVVTRGVRFLDIWTQEVCLEQCLEATRCDITGSSLPLTPPADGNETLSSLGFMSQTVEDYDGGHVDAPAVLSTSNISDPVAVIVQPSFQSTEPGQSDQPPARTISTAYGRNHSASSVRRLFVAQEQASASHRLSYAMYTIRSPISRKYALASEQLNIALDTFLGYLGAFIGFHLQSRSSMELLVTTQQSVYACQSVLAVANEVWERDFRRSAALDQAKHLMHTRLSELVQATRDIFKISDTSDDADVFIPDQGKRLVDAATLCVRSAGECVAQSRSVIERIGDFDFEPLGLGVYEDALTNGSNTDRSNTGSSANPAEDEHYRLNCITRQLSPVPPNSLEHSEITQRTSPPPQSADTLSCLSSSGYMSRATVKSPPYPLNAVAIPRLSLETVVPSGHNSSSSQAHATQQFPTLEVDIPLSSPFQFSPPSISDRAVGKTGRADSVGMSLAESTSTYISSIRHSETSFTSDVSTRASTPDQSPVQNQHDKRLHTGLASLEEIRSNLSEESDEAETQLLAETYAHELVFNKDGQISGGSLPALVERLTTHDSTPDIIFVNTFYLTFRLFTTPIEFAQSLVDRFDYVAEKQDFATPVRLRVYNVFKGWLETHWRGDVDSDALRIILNFATGRLKGCLPSASKRLIELTVKVSEQRNGAVVPRTLSSIKTNTTTNLSATLESPAPNPVITKSQLNMLKNLKAAACATILDFDPLELTRQFTIIESRIFCSIQPEELLALEWTKKSDSKAVNVRAMSTLSTDLANLVADTILQMEEPKKRAVLIKQWIKIAKKCYELNNYDTLMAIICSLNSSMVLRLKKTWDLLSPKTLARLEDLKGIVDVSRNYAILRQRLQWHVPPCIPFVGIYLTDLTFVDVGNQPTRQLPGDGTSTSASVINFDKHMKTAKIIGDLQRFQVPYRLTAVPEMQDWMEAQIRRMRASNQANVQSYYRRSLLLEPRDCQQKTSPDIESATGSFGSIGGSVLSGKDSTKDKFEFWSSLHFPTTAGSKEKVNS